ncbi:MAG TPA: PQQ-dependent sugar dehydrogenase [Kofleriaceae bacterium]|jgi:hypothetical protein
MRSGALVAALALVACGGNDGGGGPTPLPKCATPVSGQAMTARKIGQVSGAALVVASPKEDARIFVVEQQGRIRIIDENGMLLEQPFLDISDGYELAAGGEQGLLGLAFHPDYFKNGLFFIFYTTANANVLARCQVNPVMPNTSMACTTVLSIPDFASNHNGGMLEFGSDGYLYIGTGDGGSGGDPHQNGQSLMDAQLTPDSIALLGKVLRLDVDHKATGMEYGIPSDNPFANGGGAPEIWMYGVRNPWRWSFDKKTGDMWIGDVGQDLIEELDVIPKSKQKGANLGWSMYEASSCFRAPCIADNKIMPVDEHLHSEGWSAIIGGEVYRGTCYPDIVGWHYYSDNGKGGLYRARLNSDGTVDKETVPGSFPGGISSIHADARGELYITDVGGNVYHLEAGA